MTHVKIVIEEIADTWHVTQIIVTKEYFVLHEDKAFVSKAEAERDARDRAERYLREHFGIENGDITWDVNPGSPA